MTPAITGQDGPTSVLLIEHRNMEPCIRYGSLVSLADPGFRGEGIYSLPYEGVHRGDLRRVTFAGKRWRLSMDNWPDHRNHDYIPNDRLRDSELRQVTGVAMPFTSTFHDFLQQRFLGREARWGI